MSASWVVWSVTIFALLLLHCKAGILVSAWSTSWLNNTTSDHLTSLITIAVNSNGATEDGGETVKSEFVVPVVVVGETTGA